MFTCHNAIRRFADAWLGELRRMLTDSGALLFCVLLPLAYPVLYSWIYNNEGVRDVPIAVVDNSHSALSREFTQKVDASPDVAVSLYCGSIDKAREAVGRGEVYGAIVFPEDFATKPGRMEQTRVSVYCDMSYMLTYKAIYITCFNVSQLLGTEIQAQLSPGMTAREAEIAAHPLEFDEVPIFNTTTGYGNFILPAVLVLILQQALLLTAGMLASTDRERGWRTVNGVLAPVFGKALAYFTVFFTMSAYVTLVVPRMFGFVMMVHFTDWLMLMVPYMLACSFFALALTCMVRYRESVMLLVVFTSLPLLFLSGISWPKSAIPPFWSAVSILAPSTYGINGYVKLSCMGALISDITPEILALFIQTAIYGTISIIVMYRRYHHLKS